MPKSAPTRHRALTISLSSSRTPTLSFFGIGSLQPLCSFPSRIHVRSSEGRHGMWSSPLSQTLTFTRRPWLRCPTVGPGRTFPDRTRPWE